MKDQHEPATQLQTVGQSKYTQNRSVDSCYNRRAVCDIYHFFQQTSSFQSLSIDKGAGKTVAQNINASDFYCTSQIAVIRLAYCFRENRKQERMDVWELGCLSVGNQ